MRHLYFDHAAATPVDPLVLEAMMPFFIEKYGNPSSIHSLGREGRGALDASRDIIAAVLGCEAAEIIFTGSGTESCNWAIKGVSAAYRGKGNHIVTTAIEHSCILRSAEYLEQNGFSVTYLPVDREGFVSPEQVEKALRDDTILVSVIHANNEVGTIQPIREIGKIIRKKGVLFHTDACQSAGYLPIDVSQLNVDLLSINSSKIYGPKGVGAIFVRKGVEISRLIHGGGQEYRKRAGTENVAGIVGMAKALHLVQSRCVSEGRRISGLRDRLAEKILSIPDTSLNGAAFEPAISHSLPRRLPNNLNVSFKGIEGESLLVRLDREGIYVSTGSACSSGIVDPSHVLKALGLSNELANASVRFSLGHSNTDEDIDRAAAIVSDLVKDLRERSDFF